MRVVVIGAGAAGLSAAARLTTAGHAVTVVDKGRGVGGRMASRRLDGLGVADHGAQFFTAKSPDFAGEVDRWVAEGAAVVWHRSLLVGDGTTKPDGHARYRGEPSMTAPAKLLATGVSDVRTDWRVDALTPNSAGGWTITGGEARIVADAVIATPPAPQLLDLLHASDVPLDAADHDFLAGISFHRCLALMLDAPNATIDPPGARRFDRGPVEWIADNAAKASSDRPLLTVHLDAQTSLRLWNSPDADVHEEVQSRVEELVGDPGRLVSIQRWRYARPVETVPVRTRRLSGLPPLLLAGDAFDGPFVEGAVRSGWAAADALGLIADADSRSGRS